MKSVCLLAGAFLRQNRWLVVALALWPVVMSLLASPAGPSPAEADITELLQQEIFYGVGITSFLAASALHGERRSRRITGVLAKAVSRRQYLLSFLVGALATAAAYLLVTAIMLAILLHASPRSLALAGWCVTTGLASAAWLSALALLFSTFLHPVLAAVLLGGAALACIGFGARAPSLSPLITIAHPGSFVIPWMVVIVGLCEAFLFFTISVRLFANRDLAANIE